MNHVVRVGEVKYVKMLIGRSRGKRPPYSPSGARENHFKISLKSVGLLNEFVPLRMGTGGQHL